jgi:hypothetical protein
LWRPEDTSGCQLMYLPLTNGIDISICNLKFRYQQDQPL